MSGDKQPALFFMNPYLRHRHAVLVLAAHRCYVVGDEARKNCHVPDHRDIRLLKGLGVPRVLAFYVGPKVRLPIELVSFMGCPAKLGVQKPT
jgi:hypothetical protein